MKRLFCCDWLVVVLHIVALVGAQQFDDALTDSANIETQEFWDMDPFVAASWNDKSSVVKLTATGGYNSYLIGFVCVPVLKRIYTIRLQHRNQQQWPN